jgi:hypothetical protein
MCYKMVILTCKNQKKGLIVLTPLLIRLKRIKLSPLKKRGEIKRR